MKFYYVVLIFYAFSFFGWLMEVVLTKIEDKKWVNRGFLIGPLCPIYGLGILGIYYTLGRYSEDLPIFFIMSVVICSVVEYFTSWLMEKLFKNRWWDYSNKKYNLNGRICLEYAIPFGLGGSFAYYVAIPAFIKLFDLIPTNLLPGICFTLLLITIIDILVSFKIINQLKNISNTIKCDSTEAITKKVKETLLSKNRFYVRLITSFPNMKVFNKMSILSEKISFNQNKVKELKKEKKMVKKRIKKNSKN